MLVLNLPFKALMFLTLMRPSLVLFLVLWLKLVKDFLKVRRSEERRVGKDSSSRRSTLHRRHTIQSDCFTTAGRYRFTISSVTHPRAPQPPFNPEYAHPC